MKTVFALLSILLIAAGCSEEEIPVGNVMKQPMAGEYIHVDSPRHTHVPLRCVDVSTPTPTGVFGRPGAGCAIADEIIHY